MIDCTFRNDDGSCTHVNAGVGDLVILHESVCPSCVKWFPVEARAESYVVQSSIFAHRTRRKLPAKMPKPWRPPSVAIQRREHKPREKIADQMLAVARTVPKREPALIVAVAEDRLAICEGCLQWSATNQRCRASCGSCTNRPRPMADKGKDCPLFKWRRPLRLESA
jgi:hypothetical protein